MDQNDKDSVKFLLNKLAERLSEADSKIAAYQKLRDMVTAELNNAVDREHKYSKEELHKLFETVHQLETAYLAITSNDFKPIVKGDPEC